MRRKQRLLGIGALSAGLAFGACGEEPTPPAPLVRPIKILELRDPGLAFEVDFPGEVFAVRSADMAFEVSGRLVEFPVIEGQRVDEGQLLARLDSRDFRNGLAAARAERDRARVMRDRVAEAAAAGAVSQQDLSDAQARFGEAQERRPEFHRYSSPALTISGVISISEALACLAIYRNLLS